MKNDTGELTALLIAVTRANTMNKGEYHEIHCDSTYAMGRAVSTTKPKKNIELVRTLRRALKTCRTTHGYRNVAISHVKAHSDHPRNDVADELAKIGATADDIVESPHDPDLT